MKRKTVILGFVGANLDRPRGRDRWSKWRPTISLCQHDDLLVDRIELLTQEKFAKLNAEIVNDIGLVSPGTEVRLNYLETPDPWDFEQVYGVLHDFSRTLTLARDEELLVHMTTGTHVAQICLFLMTESLHFPGKLIQTSPPARPGQDAVGTYSLIDLDLSKYDQLATRFEKEAEDDISFLKSGIATRNAAFNQLIEHIEQVASRSSEPTLLMGPTGAGKSHLARRLYDLAVARRGMTGEFVEANCATLRGDAAMSTLFGHKKGAFTGAASERAGLLRSANRGMLFLDEVGELGLDEQAMLLRAIEEKIFYPMGSDTPVKSNFQLVCGTNRDLRVDAANGDFRADLLARINLWTFDLPALADRREDIAPNLDYELERFAAITGRRVRFNKESRAHFLRFALAPDTPWAGNFRDLNAAITRMATLCPKGRITEAEVDQEIGRLQTQWNGLSAAESAPDSLTDFFTPEQLDAIDLFDQLQLAQIIPLCQSSRSLADAGRKLFNVSRTERKSRNDSDRLRKYLAKFSLSFDELGG